MVRIDIVRILYEGVYLVDHGILVTSIRLLQPRPQVAVVLVGLRLGHLRSD